MKPHHDSPKNLQESSFTILAERERKPSNYDAHLKTVKNSTGLLIQRKQSESNHPYLPQKPKKSEPPHKKSSSSQIN